MYDINNAKCLISHHWPIKRQRSRIFSSDEKYVTCAGKEGENCHILPVGTNYDVSELISTIYKDWRPDIFIAKVDAYFNIVPRNLDALDCVKILILGDTQHGTQPLTRMIEYARQENYDFYITDHKRHHLWFYHLAGINNLYWLPGLFLNPLKPEESDSSKQLDSINNSFKGKSIFVGQAGKFHPRRQHLLSQIHQIFPKFWIGQLPQQQSIAAYKSADMSLNISLNGDLNLRVFEIASAGGFLLTDKLSQESGLDLILRPGKDYESYESLDELIRKLQFYKSNPNKVDAFKENIYRKYQEVLSPNALNKELNKIINNHSPNPIFCGNEVFRIKQCPNGNYTPTRIALYEFIQALNLRYETIYLIFSGPIEFTSIIDFLDLPRTQVTVTDLESQERQELLDLITLSGEEKRFEYIEDDLNIRKGSLLFINDFEVNVLRQCSQNSSLVISSNFALLETLIEQYPTEFTHLKIYIFSMDFYVLSHEDNDVINQYLANSYTAEELTLEEENGTDESEESLEKIVELFQQGNIKAAATQVKAFVDSGNSLQGAHINFANILLLAADWTYISALLPKNTNFFHTSGWLNSIAQGRPVNARDEAVPWYTYPAIDFIETIVDSNWTIFEWGSGNSTIWWSERVQKVISVENDQQWFEEVSAKVQQNINFFHKEGREYIDFIDQYPENFFDVIIIDGINRNECAYHAPSKLKESGIIIFDNSDNQTNNESQVFLSENGYFRIDFWGLIPSYAYKNCTSIYFKNVEFLKNNKIPSQHHSSVGISCQQAIDQISP